MTGYVTTELSPGYGYSGIVVAMLANLHPLGVVLTGLFAAAMFVGADAMSRSLSVPSYIADVTVEEKFVDGVNVHDQPVVIEDDVWVGANVTILKGVTIGHGSVVAAGAVVTKSCPPYSIIGGVPAKVLRKRFEEDSYLVNY